jgi:hypothetical protein
MSKVSTRRLDSEMVCLNSKPSEMVLETKRAPLSLAVKGECLDTKRFIWQVLPLQRFELAGSTT